MTALSLKTKMTVVVSLLTAVLLSILAFSSQVYFVDQFKDTFSKQQFSMLSVLAEQIDDKLLMTQNALVAVAGTLDRPVLNDPDRLRKFLANRPGTLAMFDNGIFIFSPQGRLLSGNPLEPEMLALNFSGRDYLKKTLSSQRAEISEPFLSAQKHRHPIVMFTVPIFDEKGSLMAILGGSLDLTRNNFLTKLASIRLVGQGDLYLCNSSRIMIVHKDPERLFTKDVPPGVNLMYDKAMAGYEGTGETVNSRHLRVISSFKRLKSTGWILASNFQQSEAYAPVYRAQHYLRMALLTVSLVSLLVVWYSMKHLTAPLVSFIRQIREMTLGKSPHPRVRIETDDEIGELGDAFNLLLEELEGQKGELRKQLEFSHLAQDAHDKTRLQLQHILDAAGEGIYGVDLAGRITFVNPAGAHMVGWDQEDLLGKHQHYLLHHTRSGGTPYPVEECPIYAAFSDGMPHRTTAEVFWRKDGTSFPVEYISTPIREAGALVGAVVIYKDTTKRKLAEDQLLKLSQAVMQSPVSCVITDLLGSIEFVNPKFTQMSGYEAAEMTGQNVNRLKAGTTVPEVFKNLWNTISSGHVWTGELHNRLKNGDLHWVHATIAPIRNSAGVISHYMGFLENMTERKSLEEQLRQAQKMEAIGQLAGGVAHDFNNILTVIMGFGHLLQHPLQADDPKRGYMDQILAAADRAAHLTSSLLAFSRKQVMQLQQVDLNELARRHTAFLVRIIGEDVTLQTDFGEGSLQVQADSGQIEQVLMNLATNARDAMPGGGELCIRTESVLLDQEFYQQYGYGVPGRYARITISDHGDGMDAETQAKVFEPFFTTKELGNGTGLGLSIVFGIVKQHRGYITIVSERGVGTAFSVYLPLITVQGEAAEKAPLAVPRGGRETILVVEDDPAVRHLMGSLLTTFGYGVILAENGDDAVELFEANWEKIDLALLDVIMPRTNGRQVCEALRERSPHLKVLFQTGYPADLIQDRGVLVDGIDLIMKPAQPDELARKVREMLDAGSSL